MEYSNFAMLLDCERRFNKVLNALSSIGIDVIESESYKIVCDLEHVALVEAYGSEGYDWVEWYLYDAPHMLNKDDGEAHGKSLAWDVDGNPIDFSSDEKLWEYLEKEYNKKE